METKYYVDGQGNYLGGFSEGNPSIPAGAIEVSDAPASAADKWVDGAWMIVETPEQTIARLESALDRHLDAVANSYRYTNIARMAGYAGDPDPQFNEEGTAAKNWRSAVYRLGINKIIACTREVDPDPIPTEEELIASMPLFETFLQP